MYLDCLLLSLLVWGCLFCVFGCFAFICLRFLGLFNVVGCFGVS